MTARILDGKGLAQRVRRRITDEVAAARREHGFVPGLAAVLVGDDPPSEMYVRSKAKACDEVGLVGRLIRLPAEADQHEVDETVDALNGDDGIDGILVQMPLPAGLDAAQVQQRIDPAKDVDALHPVTAGRLALGEPTFVPCTPYGCLEILRDAGVATAGARAVIVGRSNLVGRPLSILLSLKGIDATVTLAHSRTGDLAEACRQGDILVAAVGVARLITADMVKPGATVLDVGISRTDEGRVVGDVDFEAVAEVAGAITPMPGGVGPMTVTMLLQNTLEAARARRGLARRP